MSVSTRKSSPVGVGDEALKKRTGRGWVEWIEIIDRAGGSDLDHKGIVALLAGLHPELGGWWTQMVTVGYEQAKGKREINQTPEGYQLGASKTVPVPLAALYQAWIDQASRQRW